MILRGFIGEFLNPVLNSRAQIVYSGENRHALFTLWRQKSS